MSIEFKAVKRKTQFSFVTPVTEEDIKEFKETGIIKTKGYDNYKIWITHADIAGKLSPKIGDMIGINPKNPTDQWLIEKSYYEDNHVTDIELFGIQPIIIDLKWKKEDK